MNPTFPTIITLRSNPRWFDDEGSGMFLIDGMFDPGVVVMTGSDGPIA